VDANIRQGEEAIQRSVLTFERKPSRTVRPS
jgi:hypothetical protein